MTITKLRPTLAFDQDRLDALAAIAPEAFADGKINWDALREALGDHMEDEGRDAEHFGLFWPRNPGPRGEARAGSRRDSLRSRRSHSRVFQAPRGLRFSGAPL
jgi:hypothetical protein